MKPVLLEFHTPASLYLTLFNICEAEQLVALKAIVASGNLDTNLNIIKDAHHETLRNVNCHILNDAALVILKKGKLEHVMEVFSCLPTKRYFKATRILLLKRLLHAPIKVWLKGEGIGKMVYDYFRHEAKFLPAEKKLMLNKVESSRNHVYVDALSDFRIGLFDEDQFERLQHMAFHFAQLKLKREQKKPAAA